MNKKVGLFKELQRRNVFKVAIAYVVSSWLLAQVADLVLDNFGAPEWTMRALLIALAVGFPISLIISWVYEVTEHGVFQESQIDRTISITDQSGKRLDRTIIGILAIVIIFMGLERFVFTSHGVAKHELESAIDAPVPIDPVNHLTPQINAFSVAVLPFAVMSTGPDDDYFADGLTEEIINALSQLPELMVTARTSAFFFKDQNIPIGEIAGKLGVANIVEGSVRRAGNQLRITAQLVRAKDGFHLWSQTYDRHTEDTFAVQQDIAEQVATALDVVLDEGQRARMLRAGVRNVDAFTLFQKSLESFNAAHEDGANISLLRQSNTYLEQAYTLVPNFATAYLQHSDLYTHVLVSNASGILDGDITPSDVALAPAALTYDFDQAVHYAKDDSHKLIAEADRAVIMGQWRGLNTLSQRALHAPGCDVALWAHLTATAFGHAKDLNEAYSRVAVCNPLAIRATVHLARSYLWLGQPKLAQEMAEEHLQSEDHHWLIWTEFSALAMLDQFAAAERVIKERPLSSSEKPYALSVLAAMQGQFEKAAAYQDDYLAKNGPNDLNSLVMEAARGNRNEANRLASVIDSRPFGYMVLLNAVFECTCGAPFDLEATPVFASMLSESGLTWPPEKPISFPLKDW